MKKDYLWDKTGSDPEIEKLEDALKTFRQKDTTPPALPAKTFALKKTSVRPRRNYLRLTFASFACLALVMISFGVFRISQNKTESLSKNEPDALILSSDTATSVIPAEESVSNAKSVEDEKPVTVQKITFRPKKKIKQRKIKRKAVFSKPPVRKAVAGKQTPSRPERKVEISELTAEEKYAYDQLMKALAITSSKLKIVKDKVDGPDRKSVAKSLK